MDAALTRYSETVLAPVLAALSDDQPFEETLDFLVDFATHEDTPETPSGCLFTKMWHVRRRLGPVTGAHVDQLRAGAVAAYAAWLDRSASRGEIEMPAPLEVTATYIEAQVSMLLTKPPQALTQRPCGHTRTSPSPC